MKNMIKRIPIVLLTATGLIIGLRCRSPYIPPASSTSVNYLHVEGVINTANDTTLITLSRTVKLSDSVNSTPELHALVSVVGTDGSSYPLTETGNGNYIYPIFSFLSNSTKQYCLKIITSGGTICQSDFLPVKNSPPIDSLYFQPNATGIQIYSNTHDPTNNTRYYRWSFTETWIHESDYNSFYQAQTTPTDTIVPRPATNQIYTCWQSQNSSSIILNSSAKLSQDIISQNPVTSIGSLSPKFAVEYSILLYQYALTSDGFNYWQNLETDTEQLGSIFDAQPSELQGNIRCLSNPSLPVLGYVSIGAVTEKRLFIGGSQMPRAVGAQIPSPYAGECQLDTLYYDDPKTQANDVSFLYQGTAIPISGLVNLFTGKYYAYTASTTYCVDCRALGGTNQEPSYWVIKY
jgi:hypothetical protein